MSGMFTDIKLIPQHTCALTLLKLRFELTFSIVTRTLYVGDLVSTNQELIGIFPKLLEHSFT